MWCPLVMMLPLLPLVSGGRPRIAVEGIPDYDMPPNKDLDIPKYIQRYDDDTFYSVLKGNDLVVMYLRESHCQDCDFYAERFYNATSELQGLKGVSVGEIDIHDEGDIFSDWYGIEEDIPAILVFKTEQTLKYRKKPVQFVVNSRMLIDLAPFVKRMRGPTYREVSTEEEFEQLQKEAADYSDSLFFVLWVPPGTPDKHARRSITLLQRVAELERFNSIYAMVPDAAYDTLAPAHHSTGTDAPPQLVSYTLVTGEKASFEVPTKGDFKAEVKKALNWVRFEKDKRPGHKYDNMLNYYQDDVTVPANHSDHATPKVTNDKKVYVKARVVGRSSQTKVAVLRRTIEFVTQENMTMAGIERGVVGMSVGMTRLLVLPPDMREPWGHEPVRLHESSMLLLELTIERIGETNELPGRIEWETDPKKIAEHKQKVAEKQKKREEAIARGEDPDAECAASTGHDKKN